MEVAIVVEIEETEIIKKEIKKHNSIGSIKWQIAKKIRLFKRHAPQRLKNLLKKTHLHKALYFNLFN